MIKTVASQCLRTEYIAVKLRKLIQDLKFPVSLSGKLTKIYFRFQLYQSVDRERYEMLPQKV